MAAENIFAQFAQPVRSVADYMADYDAQDLRRQQLVGAQRQNALAALTVQQQMEASRQAQAKQNALTALLRDPSIKDPLAREAAMLSNPLLMQEGMAAQKERLGNEKTIADTAKIKSEAAGKDIETQTKAVAQWRDLIGNAASPEHAATLLESMHRDPRLAGTAIAQAGPAQGMAALQSIPFDQWRKMFALGAEKFIEQNKPQYMQQKLGGTDQIVAMPGLGGAATVVRNDKVTQSPDNAATVGATIRGQNLTDARARDLNAITREGQQTQVINDPERGILLVNKGTGLTRPALGLDGKAVPSENAAKSGKQWGQLGESINMARELLPGATASGAGALVDKAAGFVGQSTAGADAAAKLRTIGGWMTSNVPRMEGPQSDKDTAQYRIMAGQVGDETVPTSQRLAALDTLEEIRSRYAGNGAPKLGAKGAPVKSGTDLGNGFRVK